MAKRAFSVLGVAMVVLLLSYGSALSASRSKNSTIVVYSSKEYAEILRQLASLQIQIDRLKESERSNQAGNDLSSIRTLDQLNRERELKKLEDSINERLSTLSAAIQANSGDAQRDSDKLERNREDSRRDADLMEHGQNEIKSDLARLRDKIESSKLLSVIFSIILIFLLIFVGFGGMMGFMAISRKKTNESRANQGEDGKNDKRTEVIVSCSPKFKCDSFECESVVERLERKIAKKEEEQERGEREISELKEMLEKKGDEAERSGQEAFLAEQKKEKLKKIMSSERIEMDVKGYGRVIFYPPYIVDKENGREGYATLNLDENGKIQLSGSLCGAKDSVQRTIELYFANQGENAENWKVTERIIRRYQKDNRLFFLKKNNC